MPVEVREVSGAEVDSALLPFLLADEAVNTILVTIAHRVAGEAVPGACLLLATEAGRSVGALCRGGHPKAALTRARDGTVVDALATAVQQRLPDLPGVMGPAAEARRFSDVWCALTGVTARRGMSQRIFELAASPEPSAAPGELRVATDGDVPLVARWSSAFIAEALPDDAPPDDPLAAASAIVARGAVHLWSVEGEPVSMAAAQGQPSLGARIGLVYTPPELRRRGHAGACVRALSRLCFERGHRACFLYTDRANPTSNHIYGDIGYRPVCDSQDYWFTPAARRTAQP